MSESERNNATGVRTRLLRFCSPTLLTIIPWGHPLCVCPRYDTKLHQNWWGSSFGFDLVWFNGISIIIGYLMSDPCHAYKQFFSIQFSLSIQFSSIWPIDRTLSGAIIPGHNGPGGDGNNEVFHIPQSSRIIEASPSDWLVSYQDIHLGSLTHLKRCRLGHQSWSSEKCFSLPIFLGPFWPGRVIFARVPSMGQTDMFENYLY